MLKTLLDSKRRFTLAARYTSLCESVGIDPDNRAIIPLFRVFLKYMKVIEASSCGCEFCFSLRKTNRVRTPLVEKT
jgi:hypothetical protein